MSGRLIVCATPIGNLGDAPPRLIEALTEADVIFAEDTRRTGKLLAAFGISTVLRSYFVGNERSRGSELEAMLSKGKVVALVTDAGTPVVSDPGDAAVRIAAAAGAEVTVIPGPSAVTAALAVSGFDGDRFVFEGFLPRKGPLRRDRLEALASETRTAVLFLSPHRTGGDLADLAAALGGDRRIVVARELTKMHEEVWRGSLEGAVRRWPEDARGELTVILEGAQPPPPDMEAAVVAALEAVSGGESPSAASRRIAREFGVPRRSVYDRVINRDHA